MKWIDLPPVWLALCICIGWVWPWPPSWRGWPVSGMILIIVAAMLALLAVAEFRRARTTVIPHQVPSALVETGVFRFSRNPIYLADLLILAGLSLIWGSVVGLVLVPLLAAVLQKRFILPEEARLATAFGDDFEAYRHRTRRWL